MSTVVRHILQGNGELVTCTEENYIYSDYVEPRKNGGSDKLGLHIWQRLVIAL